MIHLSRKFRGLVSVLGAASGISFACGGSSTQEADEKGDAGSSAAVTGGSQASGSAGVGGASGGVGGTSGEGSAGASANGGANGGGTSGGQTGGNGGGGPNGGGGAATSAGAAGTPDGVGGGSGGAGAQGGSNSMDGGAPAGGTGGDGTSGQTGTLGEDCAPAGALACAGNHQKLTLVCGASGAWEVNETCSASEFCDSTPGNTAGVCREPEELCAGKAPNELFCSGKEVRTCDADGLTSRVVESCRGVCTDARCDNSCAEGVLMNCTTACGGPTNCPEVCEAGVDPDRVAPLLFEADELEPGIRYTLRLPPAPDEELCQRQCGRFPGYGAVVPVRLPEIPGRLYRIEVNEPWYAALQAYPAGTAICGGEPFPEDEIVYDHAIDCEILEWTDRHSENPDLEYQLWFTATPLATTEPVIATLEIGDETLEPCLLP